jgi:DamX protein
MSALAHAIESNAPQSVTTISANARVDYILRFSKHAVLVVDQDENVYSQVASQFLGSLTNEHNAAFIAVSPKLNDIQIRCRIVEQLFVDTLFDPEQSLAVSLINLAKQDKQLIDIVIEHTQYLSLQILHELCQLTDIAKKANYPISVLMLGTPQTGTLIANNKSLFNKKISILSGQTGQLLALNANVFKVKSPFFKLTRTVKWSMFFTAFVLSLLLLGYWLFQQDAFSLKTKLGLQSATLGANSFVTEDKKSIKAVISLAKPADIFQSLMAIKPENIDAKIPEVANPIDIVSAISAFQQSVEIGGTTKTAPINERPKRFESFLDSKTVIEKVADSTTKTNDSILLASTPVLTVSALDRVKELAITNINDIESVRIDNDYYTDAKTGFVIQIAGFTRLSVYQQFLPDFTSINVKRYHRLLNQQPMLVMTSEIYSTRLSAEQAITLLPTTIMSHQPWIKSVEAINSEISSFQRSQ